MPWSRTYVVRCPDGSARVVHRKIDDAFPLDLQSSRTKFSAGVRDGLGLASARVGGEHQSKIDSLLVAIDSKNNTLMIKFRAAYIVYMTNPCSESDRFANHVRQLSEMHDRLTEVELGVRSLIDLVKSKPSDPESIYSLFRELVSKLGSASPELSDQATKLAIADATDEARTWIKDRTDSDLGNQQREHRLGSDRERLGAGEQADESQDSGSTGEGGAADEGQA
jgi:hypothetical protein